MSLKEYAIRLEHPNGYHRFATKRVTIEEDLGGETYERDYLPFIVSVSEPKSEVQYEGEPAIPSYDVEVSDINRDLISTFDKEVYQSARCKVYTIEDGEAHSSFIGYLTDPSYQDGKFSFKIRLSEDTYNDDVFEKFTPNSFQNFEARTPKDVNMKMLLRRHADTPWQVAGAKKKEPLQPTNLSMEADSTDAVHVAYYSEKQRSLRYYYFVDDGNDNTNGEELIDGSLEADSDLDVGRFMDLGIYNSNDDPAIAYYSTSDNAIKFAKFNSNNNLNDDIWEIYDVFGKYIGANVLSKDFIGDLTMSDSIRGSVKNPNIHLSIKSSTEFYITFFEKPYNNVKIRTMKSTDAGQSWSLISNADAVNSGSGTISISEIFGSFVDSNNNLVLLVKRFNGTSELVTYQYDGTSWSTNVIVSYTNSDNIPMNGDISYQSASGEKLHIAYANAIGDIEYRQITTSSGNWSNLVTSENAVVDSDNSSYDNFDNEGNTDIAGVTNYNIPKISHNSSSGLRFISIKNQYPQDSGDYKNRAFVDRLSNYTYYDSDSDGSKEWDVDFNTVHTVEHVEKGMSPVFMIHDMVHGSNDNIMHFTCFDPSFSFSLFSTKYRFPPADEDWQFRSRNNWVSTDNEVPAVTRRGAKLNKLAKVVLPSPNENAVNVMAGIELNIGKGENFYRDFEWDKEVESLSSLPRMLFPDLDSSAETKVLIGNPAEQTYELVNYDDIVYFKDDGARTDSRGSQEKGSLYLVVDTYDANNNLISESISGLAKNDGYYNSNDLIVRPVQPKDQANISVSNVENNDVVYVKHNGFLPFDSTDDPNMVNGFFDIGEELEKEELRQKTDKNINISSDEKISKVHRFHLVDEGEIKNGGSGIGFIGLQVNNLSYDNFSSLSNFSDHDHRIEKPFAQMDMKDVRDLTLKEEKAHSVKFVEASWMVYQIDLHVDNLIGDDYVFKKDDKNKQSRNVAEQFNNRLRGSRVDVLKSSSDIRRLFRSVRKNQQEYQQYNSALINQASSKYGVPTFSELRKDEKTGKWYEKVRFALPKEFSSPFEELIVNKEEDVDKANGTNVKNSSRENNERMFDNLLEYEREWLAASSIAGYSMGEEQAENFFMNKVYRISHREVPEQSKHLGKNFPIAYGNIVKAPMLHVISKKIINGKKWTAGDDVYVYATHPCDIESPFDITIHIGSQDSSKPEKDQSDFDTNVREDVIESPFPNVKKNHFTEVVTGGASRVASDSEPLYHPYHKLLNDGDGIKTNRDNTVYGIRLRGEEWNPRLGVLDKRYPVRYGVGSSELYASFYGFVDRTGKYVEKGEPIKHPIDIIRHFMENFGEYPFGDRLIHKKSAQTVKSITNKYVASVYINEEISSSKLATKLCNQFGILPYFFDGKIRFAIPDLTNPNYSKPISSNFNIANKVSESVRGYKDVKNQVIFKYKKDNMADSFTRTVNLDKSNNKFCRKADKAKGQKREMTVDADYVRQPAVAREVAQRLAKWNCSKRITYTFDVYDRQGVRFEPGEVAPLTYEPYDIDREPVLVKKVVPNRGGMKVTVNWFPDITADKRDRSFVESETESCTDSDYTSVQTGTNTI